jgi:hypothetical protein
MKNSSNRTVSIIFLVLIFLVANISISTATEKPKVRKTNDRTSLYQITPIVNDTIKSADSKEKKQMKKKTDKKKGVVKKSDKKKSKGIVKK